MASNKHGTKVCPNCMQDGGTYWYKGNVLNDSTVVTCTVDGQTYTWSQVKP